LDGEGGNKGEIIMEKEGLLEELLFKPKWRRYVEMHVIKLRGY